MQTRTRQSTEEKLKTKGYTMISRIKTESKVVQYIEYWIKGERTTIVEYLFNGEISYYNDTDRIK
jgi:hypothetical protein